MDLGTVCTGYGKDHGKHGKDVKGNGKDYSKFGKDYGKFGKIEDNGEGCNNKDGKGKDNNFSQRMYHGKGAKEQFQG